MKKAIVTGATGFIGSWLTLELIKQGYKIIVVVRNSAKLLPEIRNDRNIIVLEKDFNCLSADDIPQDDYDVFFNLVWAGVSPEQKNDLELQISNIPLAVKMMKVCHDVMCKIFIATGTVAEYALSNNVMDLHSQQCPNDMYGCAKVSAHHFLEVESRMINQQFIWTIIPSTFGERRTDNNIITYTIKELLRHNTPKYGNLSQMWDFLYISEVVRALVLIGERGYPGKVYGIGSGQFKPLKKYVETIRDIIDPSLKLGIGEIPSLSEKSFSSCVNTYDLIKDTGFQPEISYEEGIRRTVKYWKNQRDYNISAI